MFITALLDGMGWFMIQVLHQSDNSWLYNIVMLIATPFMARIFYKVYGIFFNSKPWIIAGLIVFLVSVVLESFYTGFIVYNRVSMLIACVLFTIASGIYYYLLLKKEGYESLRTYPDFWIVAGLFLYYFASTALFIYFTILQSIHSKFNVAIFAYIAPVLNFTFYGCWAYAFRCRYLQTI
jgi:hypothetical protein